jgi:hypothetical protein
VSASSPRHHVDHCLNCNAPTPEHFCPVCGQEAVDAAVRFRDQVAHFFEEVLGVESRLPQTARLLLTRPGELTRAYNSGQRVRYVTPLKLFLFVGAAFFFVVSFSASRPHPTSVASQPALGSGYTITLGKPTKPSVNVNAVGAPGTDAGTTATFQNEAELDAWLAKPENAKAMPAFVRPHVRSLIKDPAAFQSSMVDLMSKATLVLVPLHALILRLLYLRARRFYGEHIVFSLHLHAFAYLLFGSATLLGVFLSSDGETTADAIALTGGSVYSVMAARTAYGEGWARSAMKMIVAGVGYALALTLATALVAAIAFFLS